MTQELAEVYAGRMNGILTIPRLFKYAKCDIAIKILENETLKWSTPDSFNDPFEFKSPFEYGFDWDEMKEIALRGMATILTQLEEPHLFSGNPVASVIPQRRLECKGRDPAEVCNLRREEFGRLVEKWKEQSAADRETWLARKQTYRVLCLSAVHNSILMWSHYTNDHQGVVLEFRPIINAKSHRRTLGTDSENIGVGPVIYSEEVPVAANLDDWVKFLTGLGPKPNTQNAWVKAVFTKSSVWSYENEWRIISKKQTGEEGQFSFRKFRPEELVAIYFGCRCSSESRERIIAAISNWETPVWRFQMRDERIRFELTTEPI
jgi:hypothetical protein